MTVTPVLHHVGTSAGTARAHLHAAGARGGLVVLGHGAGGGVDAPDLTAACDAALSRDLAVALVEQPWRVAGRRVAEVPARLDAAWLDVVRHLRGLLPSGRLVVGGRSAGARVACRTAAAVGADAALALAFPLVSPAGRSRDPELRGAGVPCLVVQGARDAFGVPEPSPGVVVHVVDGADHAFAVRRRDGRTREDALQEVRTVVGCWLASRQTLT
jgi:uncharacterized protein